MIITKTCNTCEHYPNDKHCIGCVWDKSKRENTKWELKENPIVIERKVLDEIQADIYEHFMTIDGGVHDKSALKCMEIIDKYKASEEISERNMKRWEEIFKAESEDKG